MGPSSASRSPRTGPTPYGDVNRLLLLMLVRVQKALPGRVKGFYLFGSLSLGDFDPESSDVDFLIATDGELSQEELARLEEMHAGIAASGLPYAKHMDGAYIPLTALRRYDPDNASHPTIGVDWGEFQVAEHGSNWILERHIVREHGVVVWGPAPETLIDPVSPRELRRAVCETLAGFWSRQLRDPEPEWLRPLAEQAFAVLTMCRALYTLQHGAVVSKPAAAAWARDALDPEWRLLIQKALAWRGKHEAGDLAETLSFVRYSIQKATEMCDRRGYL